MRISKLDPKSAQNNAIRVLLIEDNDNDVQIITHYLKKIENTDYQVNSVRSKSAAQAALAGDFDVCLLDHFLNGYTSLELIESLDLATLSGPVILITGQPAEELDQQAFTLGVSDFIAKADTNANSLDRIIRYARRQFVDQRKLSHLAEHDSLTGLLNRPAFLKRLDGMMTAAGDDQHKLLLMYLDLDGFKAVNDYWGHDIGDRALCHAAACLTHATGPQALLGRYGDDELVVALQLENDETVTQVADRVIKEMRKPMRNNDRQIVTTASIGVVTAEYGENRPEDLLRLADLAMFSAKRAGRDTWQQHSESSPPIGRLQLKLESDLRQTIEKNGLRLEYQPQINLHNGTVVGAEALARWKHAELGDIEPQQFIPLAESCGLIRPLTQWSLETAISALEAWVPSLPQGFHVAVNVSPAQLLHSDFPDQVLALLQQHHVSPEFLRLEITESFFIYDGAYAQLHRLKDEGISLALDDFGTGYSCLAQLSRLPIDTLKIDRGFIRDITEQSRDARLARTIISIANDLGMAVIAEGVETQAQAELLKEMGCDVVQGFLYASAEDQQRFSDRIKGLKP